MIDEAKNRQVSRTQPTGGAVAIYGKIADPVAACEQLGKFYQQSGMLGVKTPGAGAVLALSCMCEGITPLESLRKYHILHDGNISMRSDAMLAEFRLRGGRHKWLNTGNDGQAAEIELTYEGQTLVSQYTIQQAELAGLVRDKSGWLKNPSNMLRARAISDGIRMIAPEVISGSYTPEEISDASDSIDVEYDPASPSTEQPTDPPFTANDASQKQEVPPTEAHPQPSESKQPVATVEQLQEIIAWGERLDQSRQQVATVLMDVYSISRPQELTAEQADDAIAKMRAGYESKKSQPETATASSGP